MNNELIAKGMMIAFRGLGIQIEDWVDTATTTTVYISVPKETTDTGPTGVALAGKALADRMLTKMRDMGAENLQIKFKIRDEVWTREKRLAAENIAKTTSMYY